MKQFVRTLVVALAVMAFARVANASLVITEVMSSSAHNNPVKGDWFELTNTGAPIDLAGYYWDDNGPNGADGALFPSIVIGTNESIVIVDSTVADLPAFVASWGGGFTAYAAESFVGSDDTFSGLSSNGDQIQIWDSNPNTNPLANEVAAVTFGSAAGGGKSFEWFTNGVADGFSVAGQYGAHVADDDGLGNPGIDVGSPGVAVPEPATISLFVVGGIALIRRRR
ncbi:MAG: lamin tail domain-containing protein [Phycisphaerales bacterium]|nr:lamin tail domain-containing protein [Phycisphaerales bacterium]MCB9856333.1 lamin tail domain-containing protein [Phycisphaerales bacterium]MCB9864005.1 lamin tail domain-containing protein [Phycisphaerales bacterium]